MGKICVRLLFCATLIFINSCGTDDSTTSLNIETNSDSVIIPQNTDIEIFIFQNDQNIPSNGQLTFTSPSKGVALINDPNNTPNNPSDDSLIYSASANQIGEDVFQYTICDASNNCKTETVSVTINSSSVVNFFSNNTPFQTLSEYNFFAGELKDLNPTFGVVPYDIISPLFSDYAHKKRFVWMPNGVKATYIDDYSPLDFPIGTVLIKNFFYNNVQPTNQTKILETRIMYRKANEWDFAKYVWNDEQTEAYFNNDGSNVNLAWEENGSIKNVNYRIPSRAECFTCHNKFDTPVPIGPKPQNLNKDYNYADGVNNQLTKLIEIGYLDNNIPSNIDTTVRWDDDSKTLESRVRSYLDINCAHCHSENSYCEYRSMRFAYQDSNTDENLGICVDPETQFIPNSNIIKPNDKDLSILYYRLNTIDESFRMPLFGRTLKHEEGVRLIEEWITSLNDCE